MRGTSLNSKDKRVYVFSRQHPPTTGIEQQASKTAHPNQWNQPQTSGTTHQSSGTTSHISRQVLCPNGSTGKRVISAPHERVGPPVRPVDLGAVECDGERVRQEVMGVQDLFEFREVELVVGEW